ncbi:MAG: ABC transporter ATP-binding protein [Pyrinomonadaceae bacterium]
MLTAVDISVKFGSRRVLERVSLDLDRGETLALVGPNGAGKTTLIRTLNGTLPIASGKIVLDGRKLDEMSRREISRRIAVVAQENETKFPVTVLEFVLTGRFVHGRAFGWETDDDVRIAERALADCDLADHKSRLMNELSGGERQRVVLARALASGADILLLDEPTANLDLAHQAMMFRLVRERCRGCGGSAVVITHDLNLAAQFADRIVMLKGGRVFATGAPGEVLTAENIAAVFGVDVLLDANPRSGSIRVTNLF